MRSEKRLNAPAVNHFPSEEFVAGVAEGAAAAPAAEDTEVKGGDA